MKFFLLTAVSFFFAQMAEGNHFLEPLKSLFCRHFRKSVEEEKRTLDEIYKAALAEGGKVVVYSGGDQRGQQNATKQAFEARFPGMRMEVVVDYSIFQGPRVDVQLATDSLVPDAIQLQTLQDFPRWKRRGVLLQYKPRDWSKVYREFRDEDGYYTAISVQLLATMVNSQLLSDNQSWPRNASDLLKPEFGGGKMVTVHPNFDDSVLFYYKLVVDKYGWDWLTEFAAQNASFVCMGMSLISAVASGSAQVGVAGFVFSAAGMPLQVALPNENDPFSTYAQYLGIFKAAKHPEAAKLYLNWQLGKDSPTNTGNIWSVRTDMPPQNGYKPIWEYPNSSHRAFSQFMANYEERYRFAKQIALYLGEMSCDQSQMAEGLHPDQTQ